MHVVVLGLACILAVELFLRLPILKSVSQLTRVSQKSARVIASSRISDHWKEKALQRYSRDMALHTLQIAFLMGLAFGAIFVFIFLLDTLFKPAVSTLEFSVSFAGLGFATVASIVYYVFRKRLGAV